MPDTPPPPAQAEERGPDSRLAATMRAAPYECPECGAKATVGTTVGVKHGPLCLTGARLRGLRGAA